MLLSDHEGRVFIEGNVICPDEWDDAEAHVVCRMLGYTNGNFFFFWGGGILYKSK